MSLIESSQRNLGLRAELALVPRILGNPKSPRAIFSVAEIYGYASMKLRNTHAILHSRARNTHTHTEFWCLAGNVRNSGSEILERNAPSGSYPEFPSLFDRYYLFHSSTLTHPPSLSLPHLFPFFLAHSLPVYGKTGWK